MPIHDSGKTRRTMVSAVELENVRNEVLRKIGRNMLLYQQVEHMFKYLVANGRIEGYASELKANHKRRVETISKQTLGATVGQYLEDNHTVNGQINSDPVDLKEAHFSFTFKLDIDAVYYEKRKDALASLVAERNELIHHLLPRLYPESIERWLETEKLLDLQREKLLPEINHLKSMVDALQEGRRELAEYVRSDEYKREIELTRLRQSRLVVLLGDIASQAARQDGWMLLSHADQLIRQHAPEEIAALKERYGKKTLQELIQATDIFDIAEELTKKGGIRVLYRLKPEWIMQKS
ncbi:MAG: hypothetical protein WCH04_21200 [Gammaproteobacteria bacterium]